MLVRRNERGESIIEVVIVAFFLASMLTALVSLIMASVARNRLAKEQAVATRLAQQGLEWLRNQRDEMGQEPFATLATIDGDYCLDTTINNKPPIPFSQTFLCSGALHTCSESNCAVALNSGTQNYYRWATKTETGSQINLNVTVKWGSGQVVQSGVLNKWQR